MSVFVFSDVHGCYNELLELLELINARPGDHLIFNGDLIHKGPASYEVVDLMSFLQPMYKITIVTGNHEEKQMRWARNQALADGLGAKNPMLYCEGFAELQAQFSIKNIALLNSSKFYVQAEGFTIIHGGMAPKGTLIDTTLGDYALMNSRDRKEASWLLWCRYVNPNGFPVALGSETPEDKYWADVYQGHYGHILFGHQPFMDKTIRKFPHATGLDLGCCFGNRLAAVEIKDKQIVQDYYVNAYKQYAEPYSRE